MMSAPEIAHVYVHASYANPFRSGWGAVIQHGGEVYELHEAGEGHDSATLQIVAIITALRALPAGISVEIVSSLSYIEWLILQLPALRTQRYRSKNGKTDHSEIIGVLDEQVLKRPMVSCLLVGKTERNKFHRKAVILAGLCGEDKAAYERQARKKARAREVKPGEPSEDYWLN